MKIIHITASYKPAYIYGGPIMSVAKLCEALEEQGTRNKEQRPKTKDQSLKNKGQRARSKEQMTNEPVELHVFTTTANGKEELNVPIGQPQFIDGVRVTYFKRLTKDHTHFSPALLFTLRSEILLSRRDRSDKSVSPLSFTESWGEDKLIIHIHAWWNLVSIFSCFIAKWYKVPVVLSPRGMLTLYTQQNRNGIAKKIIHQLLGRTLLSYCHIHVTSELEKFDIQSFIIPKSIIVIPNLVKLEKDNGVKQEAKRPEVKRERLKSKEQIKFSEEHLPFLVTVTTTNEKQIFKLIFLSRIEQKKGLELLFEAVAGLEIDWRLTIAGSGKRQYVESLKAKANSLKLEAKIDWLGQVKDADKFILLAEHDLMVLTSYNENFANVVIESLSVGTPVLVSDHVGLADYVKENNFGWISSLNLDAVKNEISKAYQDVNKRNLIRENAPKVIVKDFSDELANRYIKLYQTMI